MKHYPFYFLILLIAIGITSCGGPRDVENIFIKGSDTEVNLALTLAENYMAKDPKVSIAVTGGGSGAGIAALINGKTDVANASRAMNKEEIDLAEDRDIAPTPVVVAVDAIAVIANEDLPVDALSVEQLGAIFRGDITNWKEVGGPDLQVSLYGRQSNSGTFVYFRENILKADYSQALKQMNGNAQIVEGIKTDKAAIGYVGVGYVVKEDGSITDGVKILNVREKEGMQAYSPAQIENITSGNYAVARPLFNYTNGNPKGKLRSFLIYVLSEEGQKVVTDQGFYAVSKKYWAQNEKALNFNYADKTSN